MIIVVYLIWPINLKCFNTYRGINSIYGADYPWLPCSEILSQATGKTQAVKSLLWFFYDRESTEGASEF